MGLGDGSGASGSTSLDILGLGAGCIFVGGEEMAMRVHEASQFCVGHIVVVRANIELHEGIHVRGSSGLTSDAAVVGGPGLGGLSILHRTIVCAGAING